MFGEESSALKILIYRKKIFISLKKKDEVLSQGEVAISYPELERLIFLERERNILLGESIHHEEVHAKSFNAVQKLTDCDDVVMYRHGLRIMPRSLEKITSLPDDVALSYFKDLNEAVTEELTRQYVMSQVNNSLYADDFAETKELRAYAKKNGLYQLLDDEIYSLFRIPGKDMIYSASFGYKSERMALYQIRKTLFEKYPNKFKSTEEALDVFARAMFTGHMFELSNLMEETFGKGTMRAIGTP